MKNAVDQTLNYKKSKFINNKFFNLTEGIKVVSTRKLK